MINNLNLYASMSTGKANGSRKANIKNSSGINNYDFRSRLNEASKSIGRDEERPVSKELTNRAEAKLKSKPDREVKNETDNKNEPKEKQMENIKDKLEELILNLQELSKLQQAGEATGDNGAELLSKIKDAFQELTAFQEKLGKIADTQLAAEIPKLQEQLTDFKSLLEGVLSQLKAGSNPSAGEKNSAFVQKLEELLGETLPKLETAAAALADNVGTITDGQTSAIVNEEVQEAQSQSQAESTNARDKVNKENAEAGEKTEISSSEAQKPINAAAEETDASEDASSDEGKAALERKLEKAAARENNKDEAEPEIKNEVLKESAAAAKQSKVENENMAAASLEQPIPEDGSEIAVKQAEVPKAHNVSKAEIINQIVRKAEVTLTDTQSEIRMQLEPENLGKLTLKVAVERGIITAKFTAESYEVKQIIESNFNELKDMLQQKGLEVQNFSVSVGHESKGDSSDNAAFHQWKETVRLNGSNSDRGGYEDYLDMETTAGRVINPYSVHNGEFDHMA